MRFLFPAFFLLLCLPASAEPPKPWSVAAGVFAPKPGITRDYGGDRQAALELRYAPPPSKNAPNVRVPLGVMLLHGNRAATDSTFLVFSATPTVGLNGRGPTDAGAVFAGAGGFLSASHGVTGISLGGYHVSVKPGILAEAGVNVGKSAFVTARYQWGGSVTGFVGTIGARF